MAEIVVEARTSKVENQMTAALLEINIFRWYGHGKVIDAMEEVIIMKHEMASVLASLQSGIKEARYRI